MNMFMFVPTVMNYIVKHSYKSLIRTDVSSLAWVNETAYPEMDKITDEWEMIRESTSKSICPERWILMCH
jgi:hypothetical protein